MADLIAAVSTGQSRSAIGVIRLSGDGAVDTLSRVFRPKSGKPLSNAAAGRMLLGTLCDSEGRGIDQCLCVINHAPASYTGEDTAEIHCHGSPVVISEALDALYSFGARPALPGEFTKRAFLNGKLALTEAEAVIDIIDAESPAAARNAAGQLGGAITRKAEEVYSDLLNVSSHFHAVIDWPDEDIDEFLMADYLNLLEKSEKTLTCLLDASDRGRIIKEGIPCAIVGKPNVGKSSLLNALVGYERAIVTDIAGTTRDTVEEKVILGDCVLRLIDTAGIRETEDTVEKIGVERSLTAMAHAQLIFVLWDSSVSITREDALLLESAIKAAPTVLVWTKRDLPSAPIPVLNLSQMPPSVEISTLTGQGLDELEAIVAKLFPTADVPDGEILTNARQCGEVLRAKNALSSARASLLSGITPDAVLTDIEDALSAIAAMTGREVRGDVVDRIFERFCVGK